jgi:hypothetical protein
MNTSERRDDDLQRLGTVSQKYLFALDKEGNVYQ